jgi:hypothetical protein
MRLEHRKDGWPFCPRCGEDELSSSEFPANATGVMVCLSCAWAGHVPSKEDVKAGRAAMRINGRLRRFDTWGREI